MTTPPGLRGYSLFELMIVIAMVGILAAVAMPSISTSIRRAREPAEVVRVQTFITQARNLARRANRCVRVVRVDAVTLTHSTFADSTPRCPDFPEPVRTATLTLPADLLSLPAFQNADDDDTLLFLRDGTTPYLLEPRVTVSSLDAARARTLRIMPRTGLVRLGAP